MTEWNDEIESKIESRFKELEDKVAAADKKVEGAESLLQRHKTEIGEARAEFKKVAEALGDEGTTKLKKLFDKLDTMEDNVSQQISSNKSDQSGDAPSESGRPKTFKEWREKLKADGKLEAANERWAALDEETRSAIYSSEEETRKFFEAASTVPAKVPESLIDESDDEGGSEENPYLGLFQSAERKARAVPATRAGGRAGFGASRKGAEEQQPQTKRLPDGAIPKPQPK